MIYRFWDPKSNVIARDPNARVWGKLPFVSREINWLVIVGADIFAISHHQSWGFQNIWPEILEGLPRSSNLHTHKVAK